MHRIPPTLLLVALLTGGADRALAATAAERDQHFTAVSSLIERNQRPSALRQMTVFTKAGYPDVEAYQKALDWFYAERFRTKIADAAQAATLDKKAQTLRTYLDAAEKADTLPELISELLNGAGDPVLSLVNDLSTLIHPDRPKPLVPPAPERIELAKRQVTALIEAASRGWTDGLVKVKAFAAKEKTINDMPEDDPKGQALLQEAIQLRLKAVKRVYKAHLILREVLTRGKEFNLDSDASSAFLGKWLEANAKILADWDYNFGDYHPLLKLEINTLLLESARQKTKGIKPEEIEGEMQKIVDLDSRHFPSASREAVIDIQIDTWNALLRYRYELGTPGDLATAAKYWETFKERNRSGDLRLDSPSYNRASALGKIYIMAARVLQAKGDSGAATTLFGAVASAKRNPVAESAQPWLAGSTSGLSGGGWGEPVKPQDPTQALGIARSLLKEADNTANEKLRRSQTILAATMLRSGILGLESVTPEQFVEIAPDLYNTYAVTLSKMDLRFHAALVANEGMSQIASRLAVDPKVNPWRTGTSWNTAGKGVQRLAKNTVNLVSGLQTRTKGAQGLYDTTIELVRKVAPESAGEDLELNQILVRLDTGDLDGAFESMNAYEKKYPDSWIKIFSLASGARMKKYDQFKERGDKDSMKRLSEEMVKAAEAITIRVDAELAKPGLTDEKKRDLRRAQSTAESSRISLLLADERYADVQAKLNADYWKAPPADEALRARMLRAMCQAIQRQEFARIKNDTAKNDAAALVALWPSFETAYETYRRVLPSIKDPDEQARTTKAGKYLGALFQWVSSAGDTFQQAKNASPAWPGIINTAKRAMADLIEPTLTDKDPKKNIYSIAQTLWNIGEHARAVRLYEMYQTLSERSGEVLAFTKNPADVLNAVETAVGSRPELKTIWANLRDLMEDKPGLADLIRQGTPEEDWGEKRINYAEADKKMEEFRTKAEGLRSTLGNEAWTKADKAMKALENQISDVLLDLELRTNLAAGYRELGQKDKARALYDVLYAYNPNNGTFSSAYVEIVLDNVREGKAAKADIDKALVIAKNTRNEAGNDLDLEWQATIQVYELALAKGDAAYVNSDLKYKADNFSDPSQFLIAPAIRGDALQKGDDPRYRRARNALAGELAKRYLAVHEAAGITVKPNFRIDELAQANGQPLLVFTAIKSPPCELQTVTNVDDVELQVLVEVGKKATRAPGETAPSTPAPAPTEGAKP